MSFRLCRYMYDISNVYDIYRLIEASRLYGFDVSVCSIFALKRRLVSLNGS
jgi:hypothetical protein